MIRTAIGRLSSPLALLAAVAAMPLSAAAHDNTFKAQLDGYQEVPASLSTPAHGRFRATYDKGSATLSYELSYDDIDPTQAHIHLGQRGTNGGISLFLCSNLPNPPAGTPPCPPGPATVSGSLQAADVIGPAGQGIAPGELDEVLDAMREGAAYVNMHTVAFPGGEARGQVK